MHFNGGKMPPSLMACWAPLPEGRNIVSKRPHAERATNHRREATSHGVRNHAVTAGKCPERHAACGKSAAHIAPVRAQLTDAESRN